MPRLSETHHLPDLREESEYDLWSDRFGSWIGRSSKSRSPDSMKQLRWERTSSSGVSSSASPDCFYEATGRRSSSDHGQDLTTDTDSFMIGNRVYVGGVKPGRITFIGEVHFAPGEWAGIVLDEPEGKNDGAVSGKRYFQCEPKKGIFSRLTRLTRERIVSASTPDGSSMDTSFRSMTSPARSGTTSPTYSMTSTSRAPKTSSNMEIGDRVIVKSATGSKLGYLRYHGEPDFASGVWCGIEFEDATGKNDGTVGGKRYFLCAPNHGLFVPEAKVSISPMARKARMSRVNSQESLTSNITLGSMASTNTSKLRLSATQKRLSSLNKAPSVTSTPKPSYSLQDILREKTNHIEQLIKERENDREEMSANEILFQKNLNLYKEKAEILASQLEEEKKKSEDLQFIIDEAAILKEDADGDLKQFKDRIAQLETEIKNNAQASGDGVPSLAAGQLEELEKLRVEVTETKTKLQVIEQLRVSLENEVKSANEKVIELKNDLDIKTSGANASEECMKDEMSYLEKRIEELEQELGENAKTIVSQKIEIEQISSKSSEIEKLKNELETVLASDAQAKEFIKEKDSELLRIHEKETILNERVVQLEKNLNEKSELFVKKELEHSTLQNAFASVESEFQNLQKSLEEQSGEVTKKSEVEENMKRQIAELLESQVKLNSEISTKDSQLKNAETVKLDLEKELSEREKCIAGLEAEVKSINKIISEKDATITQWTKDCSELEVKREKSKHELESSKQALVDELAETKRSMQEALDAQKNESEEIKKTLNEKIEESNKQRKEKESQLEKIEKNVNLLNEVKTAMDEKMLARENELKELSAKLSKIEREDSEKGIQVEKLTKALDETSKKLQEAEMKSKNLQDDKNALEVDKNDLNRKLGANEEKIAQLNDHKSKLQQDLESTKNSSLDTNSELSKLNNELREKQAAFESFQSEADAAKLNLQRRVDELERQNNHFEQQVSTLKSEMEALQAQKVENENQLNQELQNIKQSSDEEKSELGQQLNQFRSASETEKLQLNREKQQIQENLNNLHDEMEAKTRDLNLTIANLQMELESVKNFSKQNESSMGGLVDEMKKKESQLSVELDEKCGQIDELKNTLEELKAAKVKEINDLVHLLENERDIKNKLEINAKESETKFRELEDEQVDLVNRQEQLKLEKENLLTQLESLNQFHKALDERLALEKKDSESFKLVADERVNIMEQKIDQLQQVISGKDQENTVVVEKLHLREEEITQLQTAIKNLELKLETETGDTHKLLSRKDEELLKVVHESTTKDNLIADLKNNLENIQACLNSTSSEKESSTELVQKLNQEISTRDSDIRDLKMKIFSVEKVNKEIEDQMKNIVCAKEATITESQMRIVDLMEQVQLLDEVKEKEVFQLNTKLYLLQEQLDMNASAVNMSTSNLDVSRRHESELKLKLKDLELRETELLLLNQGLTRKVSELESMKGIPRTGDAYDQELKSHIEFLNSIIADMHKTNLDLTKKVEVLSSGSATALASDSSHSFDLDFLVKKKPAPRMYCDICEEFDGHDTEDCPTQCSEMDLPAPPKNKKERKLPPPRKFCDHCDLFDTHDTEDCPHGEDETF